MAQAARSWTIGIRCVDRNCFEGRGDAEHSVRSWTVTRISQQRSCQIGNLCEYLPSRVQRSTHVRHLSGQTGRLRLAKALTCSNQPVEYFTMFPVELVHSPGRDGRLDQRLYEIRLVTTPRLLQLRGECITRGGKLCQ